MKTAELAGAALDWAVAEAGGVPIYRSGKTLSRMDVDGGVYWQPSTDWAQGGPIVEREIDSHERDGNVFQAVKFDAEGNFSIFERIGHHAFGPTLLIAAMRCYVASKLGDEIDIPKELK